MIYLLSLLTSIEESTPYRMSAELIVFNTLK